jgi:hypothetical protein
MTRELARRGRIFEAVWGRDQVLITQLVDEGVVDLGPVYDSATPNVRA